MEELWKSLKDRVDQFSVASSELVEALTVIPEEKRQATVSLACLSLDDTMKRIEIVRDLLQGMTKETPKSLLMIPSGRLATIIESIDEFLSIKNKSLEEIGNIKKGNIPKGISIINFIEVSSFLFEIGGVIDGILNQYYQLSSIIQPKAFGDFSSSLTAILEHKDKSSAIAAEISQLQEHIHDTKEDTARKQEIARAAAEEAQAHVEKAAESRATAEQLARQASEQCTQINEIREKADNLETSVTEYSSNFSKFQQQLDAREKAIKEGKDQLEALQKELEEKHSEIKRIENKAKEMLGGATIAGLSSVYKEELTLLDQKLNETQISYYASIAILFILMLFAVIGPQTVTAFIAAHVLGQPAATEGMRTALTPDPTKESDKTASIAAIHSFTSVASRFAIILPGLLLAGFASSRHSSLFRLREQYAYKYSIAASVEGFKNQAPSLQEEIAASVFHELLFSPIDRIDRSQPIRRNRVLERLISPALAAVRKFGKHDGEKDGHEAEQK